MAKQPKSDASREAAPQAFPEVPPPAYSQAVNASWVVESMMQVQQSIGKLEAKVDQLTSASDKQSTKIDKISHIIFAAGAVLAVILTVGGFFLNKIWDGIFVLIKAAH